MASVWLCMCVCLYERMDLYGEYAWGYRHAHIIEYRSKK